MDDAELGRQVRETAWGMVGLAAVLTGYLGLQVLMVKIAERDIAAIESFPEITCPQEYVGHILENSGGEVPLFNIATIGYRVTLTGYVEQNPISDCK